MSSNRPRATAAGKIISKRSKLPTDWLPNNPDKETLLNWVSSSPDKVVLLKARDGDWGLLALYLDEGNPITPNIRKFLSEVLRGDRKRLKNRPQLASTMTREMEIAEFVMKQEDAGKRRGVIAEAEEKFRCSRSTVQRALKKHRGSLLLLGRRWGLIY
jgi:hypothetical protein